MNSQLLRRAGAALAAVMLLTLAACGGGDNGGSDSAEDRVLLIASSTDVSSLDPIRGNAGSDHVLLYPLYDTLVAWDENFEPAPGLAESWEFVSSTELQLTLREGLTFHDGEPLDAEAVKYNLDRAMAEGSNLIADLASVSEVRVDDELSVTLLLERPDSSIVMVLADRAGMMVSPAAAEAAGGDLSTEPVGAGGWSFVDYRRGSTLEVERFDDYWDTEVDRAAGIRYNIITDPKTRVTSLRSGQQDIALDLPPSDADALESADGVELDQAPRLYLYQVYFDREVEEISDPLVRRALSVAIDREAILNSGFFGRGSEAHGFLPEGYWAAPPESVRYEYDPEEARSLLAEAGWADGFTFDMLTVSDSVTTRVAEILKEQWAEVGVTVNIVPRDVVQSTSAFFNDRDAPALLSAWTGRPDPALTYRLMFTEAGYFNPSSLPVPGLDEALLGSDEATSIEDRQGPLQDAALAVYENTANLPLTYNDSLTGYRSDVVGFENNLLGKPKFLGVSFSE